MSTLRRTRWMHAALAALLLLVTAVPVLSRMTCLQSGRSELTMGPPAPCCPDDDGPAGPTVAAPCCVGATVQAEPGSYLRAQAPVPGPGGHVAVLPPPPPSAPLGRDAVGAYAPGPPPLAVQRRLARLQVLRI